MSVSDREYVEWRQRQGLEPHNNSSYVDELLMRSFLAGFVQGVNYSLRVVNEQAHRIQPKTAALERFEAQCG